MRANKILHSTSSSSRSWLSRQSNDPYVKARVTHPSAYRSRSAFKLLEIDTKYGVFLRPDIRAVVDLGAAPGGWSQVIAERLGWTEHFARENEVMKVKRWAYGKDRAEMNKKFGTWSSPKLEAKKGESSPEPRVKGKRKARKFDKELAGVEEDLETELEGLAEPRVEEEVFDPLNIDNEVQTVKPVGRGTIVAVDVKTMDPIHGVLDIQADFLDPATKKLIDRLLKVKGNTESKADIILSDMAANISGNTSQDIESSLRICQSVFAFAKRHLRTAESIGSEKGGVLLMKYFSHPLLEKFCQKKLRPNFSEGWKGIRPST